jgi:CRISPR/Cas system-associated exonuclease Cas4 (RecB family)
MTLPPGLQFSQGSLQDYVDCPRRFQLRYLLRLAWPAIEVEPALENEHYLQQGAAFHRLVHQHVLGIPAERLSSAVTDLDLRRWWRNYLAQPPADLPPSRYPEIVLSAPVGSYRLVAKYDLVAVDAGRRAVIVDWKTSRRRPRRTWLAGRLQTRVYPYLLVRAGAHLNGGQPLQPEQVEMAYWFADFPEDPERFAYDAAQYRADGVYLASLMEEIERLGDEGFPLAAQERRCRYCVYRSLCRRGVGVGVLEEAETEAELGDEFDVSLDFEQIAEVEY